MLSLRSLAAALALWTLAAVPLAAQTEGSPAVRLAAEPASLTLQAGASAPLRIVAYDAAGNVVPAALRVSAPRAALRVSDGTVTALAAGEYQIVATTVPAPGAEPLMVHVPVKVTWPPVARVEVEAVEPGRLYAGTMLRHQAAAFHADGTSRPRADVAWSSSDPAVATVDRFGNVVAHRAGTVTVSAEVEGVRGTRRYTVPAFPATRLEIRGGPAADAPVRTGDVVQLSAAATGAGGRAVPDLPVTWSYTFVADDSIWSPGAAGTVQDGSFVAEVPGLYMVTAASGGLTARRMLDVRPRGVVERVVPVGHGRVAEVHTSDLWVFEGLDGRDYAVTGTWGAEGKAYFWDVTDPAAIVRIDSIQVDARTINDVKVSPDGRYAAISREGASNRRNGVVIVDLSNPRDPEIASVFEEGLTGGVHNMFATNEHLFALSAGDKYVILDVRDIRNPRYVSEYDHPNSRIHDVWVHDGIAYSSEWQNGVVIVDVGNGKWGGSIENPRFVTNIPYPVGATHAAFPYHQKSTGKLYLFLGDEIMTREGLAWAGAGLQRIPERGGTPSVTQGYIHVIDWTDPENPRDVARYQVPEFGTHNLWVENDRLYVAYYEGGLRVVDVSGELMGSLADQGREIAVFKAFDPQGYAANAPMAWGPQPYKGHVFFSDFNSGLWAVKLEPITPPTP